MKGLTRALSSYVVASQFDDLPVPVRHEGVRALVNWVGCAVGGAREPSVECALEFLTEFNSTRQTTVVGRREKLDALNAAFINSMSSSILAFNDTHYATVGHPTSPVVAAVLALAERMPITGKDLLHALILGIEIQCRVGNMLCVPPAKCHIGLTMVGLVGGIGAAAAASKLMGLDETGTAVAIGLAANDASGLREAQATMGRDFTRGHAARSGLTAALLAARGFTCSDEMLEGPKGFAFSYGHPPNLEAAIDKLGQAFEISTISYKPYPSGFAVHPIIDACLEIAHNNSFDPTQIDRIELTVNPLVGQLTNRIDPKNRSQALVSLQHWAAASLIYRAAGIAQATDAVVRDPTVADLRHKVVFTGLAGVGRDAAHARVVLKNGKNMEASILHCRGSIDRPMTDEEITEKTCTLIQTVFPAGAGEKIVAECWGIEGYSQADMLCKQLAENR